jgi:hypothetical protein
VKQPAEKTTRTDKVATAETGASADTAAPVIAKAAPPPAPSKAGEEQPAFAPEPTTPAAGTRSQVESREVSKDAGKEANKNEALAKEAKQKEDAAAEVADRQARDERVAEQERDAYQSRSRKAAGAGRGGALNSVAAPSAGTAQAKRTSEDDATTREVGGHRFRKQGNAWIDLAYDGRSVTTIARGSEQYRSLVADEPGIHNIAQRLGGEVLIVWNGRAYRIR